MPELHYQPLADVKRPRTSVTGVFAAVGLAGVVCVVLAFLAVVYVSYVL